MHTTNELVSKIIIYFELINIKMYKYENCFHGYSRFCSGIA